MRPGSSFFKNWLDVTKRPPCIAGFPRQVQQSDSKSRTPNSCWTHALNDKHNHMHHVTAPIETNIMSTLTSLDGFQNHDVSVCRSTVSNTIGHPQIHLRFQSGPRASIRARTYTDNFRNHGRACLQ